MKLRSSQTLESSNGNIIVAEDWTFQFETKEFYYFKSDLTGQLDELYGDVGGQIVDIEQNLLREIENLVIIMTEFLKSFLDTEKVQNPH